MLPDLAIGSIYLHLNAHGDSFRYMCCWWQVYWETIRGRERSLGVADIAYRARGYVYTEMQCTLDAGAARI